jgi:hypothetical protein
VSFFESNGAAHPSQVIHPLRRWFCTSLMCACVSFALCSCPTQSRLFRRDTANRQRLDTLVNETDQMLLLGWWKERKGLGRLCRTPRPSPGGATQTDRPLPRLLSAVTGHTLRHVYYSRRCCFSRMPLLPTIAHVTEKKGKNLRRNPRLLRKRRPKNKTKVLKGQIGGGSVRRIVSIVTAPWRLARVSPVQERHRKSSEARHTRQ